MSRCSHAPHCRKREAVANRANSFSAQRDDDGREGVAEYAGFSLHVCLKTPYRDGTTHIVLEPLDFMARLAALVPPPRVHQTRYHGVLAPGSALRAAVTPSGRGQGASKSRACGEDDLRGTPFVPRAPPQPPLL